MKNFNCGSRELDDFLNTKEVERYEEQGLGKTTLVYYEGEMIAFFTVSSEGLRIEYLKKWKHRSKMEEMKVESVPSIKIGRLAVSKDWQNRGVGRTLIRYIAGMALETGVNLGVRLLILETKPNAFEFYHKCGFEYTHLTKRQRKRKFRTMFFDLRSIEDFA